MGDHWPRRPSAPWRRGGRPLPTPFGTFYSPNITPNPEYGIGRWSDQGLLRALSQGVSPAGEHYYPAFPYTAYTRLTRQDALSIKAYLDSTEPVPQPNRHHDLTWYASYRWPIAVWKWRYFVPGEFHPPQLGRRATPNDHEPDRPAPGVATRLACVRDRARPPGHCPTQTATLQPVGVGTIAAPDSRVFKSAIRPLVDFADALPASPWLTVASSLNREIDNMRRPRALRTLALGMVVGLLSATVPSLAIAAGPSAAPASGASAAWSGPRLTTRPMSPADAATIDALAQAALAQSPDLPGLWIGVWDPAKGFHTQAYGEAVKGGAKATTADHGRIGSVTKTFTVVAVLEQVAAGRLTLDSRIDEVLPALATRYPAITGIRVDQLAGMRIGIQDYANTGIVIQGVAADPARVWTVDDLIDAAMTLPLSAPTGGYSTTNTIILGQMLEKLTGKPIDRIRTDVARRAGLTQSALQAPGVTRMPEPTSHGLVAATGAKELGAVGATLTPGMDVFDWTVRWGQADGGMYSTSPTWAPGPGAVWASTIGATAGSDTPASLSAGSPRWLTTGRPAPPSWPSSTRPAPS